LDILAPQIAMHGEKCGIGTIMMAKLHGIDWIKIRDSLEYIHAPTESIQLGIDEKTLAKALVMAPSIRPNRYTILHKKRLDYEQALHLARSTNVI
jgi:glycerol-1-phosphate dehydrogenase [NAD(P)+]